MSQPVFKSFLIVVSMLIQGSAWAQGGLPIVNMVDDGTGSTQYSLTLQLVALMTVLTLLPSLMLMMTSFVRIIIVMSLLRQALGTAQTPPNQVLLGLALFLTIFIMMPVFSAVWDDAITPYFDESIGFEEALLEAKAPFRTFMLNQTREADIAMFLSLIHI